MDMIKIGDSYITAECIAAVSPDMYDPKMLRVFLTGGKSMCVKASMTQAEIALIDAGLIEPCQEISSEDIEILNVMYDGGHRFVAKDKNGSVYAFTDEPEKHGAYWESEGDAERIYDGDFDWLSADDDEPTSIEDLLSELGVSLLDV